MPEINTSSILIKESERLGSFQRKILDLLEHQLDGLTSNEMLEEVYRIPTMLGTLLKISMNIKLFQNGERKEITREEIIEFTEDLIIKVQNYILSEDVEYEDKGGHDVIERLPNISADFKRFKTYMNYDETRKLQESLRYYIATSSGDDAVTTHEYIFSIITQTIRIGEKTQGFRKELRVLRAAGEEEGEEKTRHKTLANKLRANLAMTLITLRKRGLVLENVPAKGAYWKGRPSRFVITEKGYRLLQQYRAKNL